MLKLLIELSSTDRPTLSLGDVLDSIVADDVCGTGGNGGGGGGGGNGVNEAEI